MEDGISGIFPVGTVKSGHGNVSIIYTKIYQKIERHVIRSLEHVDSLIKKLVHRIYVAPNILVQLLERGLLG